MKKQYNHYFILLLLAIIWGSSFILMKRGLDAYSDMQVASLRLFIAFLSLLPFLFKALKKVKKDEIIPLLIAGVIGNGIPAFLFTKAQTTLDSSFVGILNSLTPVFTLILGIYFFKTNPTKINIIGIVIGFCGAFLLYSSEISSFSNVNSSVLLIILATFFYGVSVNVIRKYLKRLDSISISAIAFLFIGPFAGYYVFTTDFLDIATTTNQGMASLGYIAILAIVGTSFSLVVFNKLIKETSAIFAASVTYLIPIVALMWGLFEDESIKLDHYMGIVVILCGVYLVNKKTSIQ